MKHYAKTRGYEDDLFNYRRYFKHSEKNLSETKHIYRRRERRVLDRMVEEEVVSELSGYTEQERAYWWGEFQRTRCDFEDLENAEVYLRESGQWTPDHTRIFAAAYREIRKRSEKAYREWFAVAA